MYLRSTPRKNKDGSVVRYLQLAHNVWDPNAKRSKVQVIYNFGREDATNRAALQRLITSVTRLLEPGEASAATAGEGLEFHDSRPLGGTWVLQRLWERLGIEATMRRLLVGRRVDPAVERVLFALVANRALAPSSKLAAARWVGEDVVIEGLAETSDDACYRAMDWLLEVSAELEREVFWQVATLLDLEIDVLLFDTTSTYFQIEEPDEPIARNHFGRPFDDPGEHPGDGTGDGKETPVMRGFRSFGKSKDHRDDLPQVVVGMAVTRTGIPVRCWCWPGATNDSALIRQVKTEMRDWTLARIIWVADRGFTSADNRRYLRRGDHHYILGEKLRSGSAEATAALARPGRYQHVRDNLQVKEVRITDGERFVICFNPEQAQRDAALREVMTGKLTALIADTDRLSTTKRAELRGRISTMPGLNRFLRTTPSGLLRIDQAKVKTEEHLDGKYLLRTSDPKLSAEDIALGYKQLLEVERGWRDMKQIIDLRPVYHRKEERIRAHVLVCWLALLLIRIIETSCGDTWPTLRRELQRIQLGTFAGPAGHFGQRTEITTAQRAILTQLEITPPPRIYQLTPTTSGSDPTAGSDSPAEGADRPGAA